MSNTKSVIIIPDGASDEPLEALGHQTPLQAAALPAMDRVAMAGQVGLSHNVPDRFLPASDVATLSLLGYDPLRYYTGRAPLEAAAMGVTLGPDDYAVRCNLVNITNECMTDFTAGHITSREGAELLKALQAELGSEQWEFVPGVSYRNLLIVRGDLGLNASTTTTPPHDIPDRPVADYLPQGGGQAFLRELMTRGSQLVAAHPVNAARIAQGHRPANAIWLWGQGQAPSLPSFASLHGLRGAMISAVDLVRGVAALAGWHRIDVPGATGYLDTDYAAKGQYAIKALNDYDIVCVHVEAPDEASHEGRAEAKVKALEEIDTHIVGPVWAALQRYPSYRMLITPDHSTLLRTRAHDRAPVPWAIASTGHAGQGQGRPYHEASARAGQGPVFNPGYQLMDYFLKA